MQVILIKQSKLVLNLTMVTRLALTHRDSWLEPGTASYPKLFHADSYDRILVVPPHLGQGYVQEISLREDLSIFIHDYQLSENLVLYRPDANNRIDFEFPLSNSPADGYSHFEALPSFW